MSSADIDRLTPRQKEILRLLLAGFDSKSIARELDISVHTVAEHLREARRHLGVSNSREAARILGQAEAAPPNFVGPSTIGVAASPGPLHPGPQSSPRRTLVIAGVCLMILLAAATALALASSDSPPPVAGNGATTAEQLPPGQAERNPSPYPVLDVPVPPFERVKVTGAIKLLVFAGGETEAVRLQGPRALLADAIVKVEDGTLSIRYREGANWSWNPGSGMNVVVRAETLEAIEVDGPGQVEVWGPKGAQFAATTQAAGSLEIRDMAVDTVQLTTEGAGGITASGSAREARYSVGGAGSIDAMRLRVSDADIAIGGAGSNYANVSGEARIALARPRGGRVEVVGGGECIATPADTDRVDCR